MSGAKVFWWLKRFARSSKTSPIAPPFLIAPALAQEHSNEPALYDVPVGIYDKALPYVLVIASPVYVGIGIKFMKSKGKPQTAAESEEIGVLHPRGTYNSAYTETPIF